VSSINVNDILQKFYDRTGVKPPAAGESWMDAAAKNSGSGTGTFKPNPTDRKSWEEVAGEASKQSPAGQARMNELSTLQGAVRLALLLLVAAVGFVAFMQILPVQRMAAPASKLIKAVK